MANGNKNSKAVKTTAQSKPAAKKSTASKGSLKKWWRGVCDKIVVKDSEKKQEWVKPVIAWCIIGGEILLATILFLIVSLAAR